VRPEQRGQHDQVHANGRRSGKKTVTPLDPRLAGIAEGISPERWLFALPFQISAAFLHHNSRKPPAEKHDPAAGTWRDRARLGRVFEV
jgi:hypothetical protein